jgi:hypothetical protein
MKQICLLISLLVLNTASAASSPDVAKYLAQRGWTAYDSKTRLAIPVNDIAPLTYYAKNANVPSCGLLAGTASALKFIDILSTEPGEQYPHCTAINDVAAFKLAGKDYLVFEYTDRETRNETYEQFFYVYKDKTGEYVADAQLNEGADANDNNKKPPAKSAPKASEGIRLARAYAIKQAQPGMELQARDLVVDGTGAFAVFKDKTSANCTFVVDNGTELSKFGSELFAERDKCIDYLASSKLDTPAKTYYLGMFKGGDAATRIALFSVTKSTATVRAEKELAQSAASTGKIADIKSLKAYLVEAEKK